MSFWGVLWLLLLSAVAVTTSELEGALQHLVDDLSKKHGDAAVAISFRNSTSSFDVVAGYRSEQNATAATANDLFLFGSATKMYTAAAVMQLVQRGMVHLTDLLITHVDPWLQRVNGTTLLELWGLGPIQHVQIGHLLAMHSGIPDYDTAWLEKYQLDHPTKTISPFDIIHACRKDFVGVPGVPVGHTAAAAGYSSTNYVLLGLLLAARADVDRWEDYDQGVVLPDRARRYNRTFFAVKGVLGDMDLPVHPVVHGYEARVNGTPVDVYNISAVGGWTCGNLVASPHDVAQFTFDLLGSKKLVLGPRAVEQMSVLRYLPDYNWWYGMGVQAQTPWWVDKCHKPCSFNEKYGRYYGHGGLTYGFQTVTAYSERYDFALTIAMNRNEEEWVLGPEFHTRVFEVVQAHFDAFQTPAPTGPPTPPPKGLPTPPPSPQSPYPAHTVAQAPSPPSSITAAGGLGIAATVLMAVACISVTAWRLWPSKGPAAQLGGDDEHVPLGEAATAPSVTVAE
eukprot:Sspe_Gene.11107::Locus_3744_Transcript_1_1_Confidence_1.000_Length_1612::g.11107::m.11107/K01286/E3.4.16.4; D-alanyl-D-alanine carboxypeptidase